MKIARLLLIPGLLVCLGAPSWSGPSTASLEADVLAEINLLRAHPDQYATFIQKKTDWIPSGKPADPAAVKEAIEALRKQTALPPLQASAGLVLAARDLVAAMGPAGLTSAAGADIEARMGRHGKVTGASGECLSYGDMPARDIIIDLVVDADFPERDDRKVLLEPKMHLAGVACGPHKQYQSMCVIDLAQELGEK